MHQRLSPNTMQLSEMTNGCYATTSHVLEAMQTMIPPSHEKVLDILKSSSPPLVGAEGQARWRVPKTKDDPNASSDPRIVALVSCLRLDAPL